MADTFPCVACGGPNEPEAGSTQMNCSYCGANLTIPAGLRRAAAPKAEVRPAKPAPAPRPEVEASDLLRQAQPVAAKALGAYVGWTWLRRMLPTCLTILVIGLCTCALLSAAPFILQSIGR